MSTSPGDAPTAERNLMDSKTKQNGQGKGANGPQTKVFLTGKGQAAKKSPPPAAHPPEARTAPAPRPPPRREEDKSKNSLVFIPIDSLWSEQASPPPQMEHRVDPFSRPSMREAPQAVTAPEPLYRILFDSMYEAALITNLSGTIGDANSRAGELTGLHPLRLCGQPIENVIPGMDEMMLQRISDHVQLGRFAVLEGWCQRDDGERVQVEIAVSRIDRSRQHELLFALRNQAHRGEPRDRDQGERRMLHYAPCGIALVDDRHRMQYVNPTFLRIWKHPNAESVVGKSAAQVWPADIASLFLTPLKTNAPWAGDISVTRPDGRIKSFQTNAVPYPGPGGETAGVLLSFVDITSLKAAQNAVRREAEAQLRHASAKSDFSGSLNIVAMGDLIRLIASSSKTGTLEILGSRDEVLGGASFESGQVVFAQYGNLHGEAAVVSMLRDGGVSFRFRNNYVAARDEQIRRTTISLLHDALGSDETEPYSGQDDAGSLPVL